MRRHRLEKIINKLHMLPTTTLNNNNIPSIIIITPIGIGTHINIMGKLGWGIWSISPLSSQSEYFWMNIPSSLRVGNSRFFELHIFGVKVRLQPVVRQVHRSDSSRDIYHSREGVWLHVQFLRAPQDRALWGGNSLDRIWLIV